MIQEHEEDYGSDNDNIEIESEEENTVIPPIYQKGRYFAEIGHLMAQKVTYEQVMELMRETCACIVHGGQLRYVTKNFENGNISYKFVLASDLKQ